MVARLGQVPPVADQNDPVIRDMVWALSDADVARYFAELTDESRPRPEWTTPLQRAGLLNLSIGQRMTVKIFPHRLFLAFSPTIKN